MESSVKIKEPRAGTGRSRRTVALSRYINPYTNFSGMVRDGLEEAGILDEHGLKLGQNAANTEPAV